MSTSKNPPRIILLQIVLLSALIVITPVFGAGTGLIRIAPETPIVLSSPITFTIWVEGDKIAYDPHIFLVITQTSHGSLSDDVVVAWEDSGGGSVSIATGDWDPPGSYPKLPPGTSSGAGYTIDCLKSHLVTKEDIMWAFVPILEGPLGTAVDITVTFPTGSNPHAMVYILGKSEANGEFDYDMRVPPTEGIRLLVPEVPYGTIAAMASMLVALILYIKRPFF